MPRPSLPTEREEAEVQQDGQATLGKVLTIIQNRQPLPNEGCSSGNHLHLEHNVFHNRFKVVYEFRVASGA
jgi:hypothetical protein